MFDNVLNRENNIQKVSTSLVPSYVLYTLFGIYDNCLKHSKILSFFMVHDMELNISQVIFDSTVKIWAQFYCWSFAEL